MPIGEKQSGQYRAEAQTPRTKLEIAAESTLTGIANAFLSSLCPAQVTGNNGGITGGRFDVRLCAWFRVLADETIYEKGRPLCQYTQLYGMSGFIQCGESDVNVPCTKPELDAIRNYMVSGMFLE